ncbi:MAG: RDD family protein [Anaerolineales bacterium]|nr:RDD family protein [Anaerolineales bacterium]
MTEDTVTSEFAQHLQKAYQLEDQNLLDQALIECDLAIELEPGCAEAHNLRGVILDCMGEKELAATEYKQAFLLNPDFLEAQENLKEIEHELGLNSPESIMPLKKRTAIASFWKRAGAMLIDLIILFAPLMIFGFTFKDISFSIGPWGKFIGIGVMLLYFGIGNSNLTSGQTIGKKILKTEVIDRNGNHLPLGLSILRASILSIIIISSNWALPFFNIPIIQVLLVAIGACFSLVMLYGLVYNKATRQGTHDLVVNSFVISVPYKVKFNPSTAPNHQKIVERLLIIGLLIGIASFYSIDIGDKLGIINETDWQKFENIRKSIGQQHDHYSVKLKRVDIYQSNTPDVWRLLEIDIWTRQNCRKDILRCEKMMVEAANLVINQYDGVHYLTGIRVDVYNRFDFGLAQGYLRWRLGYTIRDWRKIYQANDQVKNYINQPTEES